MIAFAPPLTSQSEEVLNVQQELQRNIRNDDGSAILRMYEKYKAIFTKPIEVVDTITGESRGVKEFINLPDEFGLTFLQEAAILGKVEAVKTLLVYPGIDVNARSPKNNVGKHIRNKYDAYNEKYEMGGRTALQLAEDQRHKEEQGHEDVVYVLKRDRRVERETPEPPEYQEQDQAADAKYELAHSNRTAVRMHREWLEKTSAPHKLRWR